MLKKKIIQGNFRKWIKSFLLNKGKNNLQITKPRGQESFNKMPCIDSTKLNCTSSFYKKHNKSIDRHLLSGE